MTALAGLTTGRISRWVLIAVWIVLLGAFAPLSAKLNSQKVDTSTSLLPEDSEAGRVAETLATRFAGGDKPTTVLLYRRAGGLTPEDQKLITENAQEAAKIPLAGTALPAFVDGKPAPQQVTKRRHHRVHGRPARARQVRAGGGVDHRAAHARRRHPRPPVPRHRRLRAAQRHQHRGRVGGRRARARDGPARARPAAGDLPLAAARADPAVRGDRQLRRRLGHRLPARQGRAEGRLDEHVAAADPDVRRGHRLLPAARRPLQGGPPADRGPDRGAAPRDPARRARDHRQRPDRRRGADDAGGVRARHQPDARPGHRDRRGDRARRRASRCCRRSSA